MRRIGVRSRMKSMLCVLLTAALVASSFGAGSLAVYAAPLTLDIGVDPESVTATLHENGALSITGAGEIRDFTAETAPFQNWDVRSVDLNAGVTAIGDYTFYNCKKLDGFLTIPKGIVRIGSFAFSGETAELAPKPGFVENLFTEALVTSAVKDTPDGASSDAAGETAEPAPADDTASSAAEEGGAGTVMVSEEKMTAASGPEDNGAQSEPPVASAPQSALEPVSEPAEPAESSPAQQEPTPAPTELPEDTASAPEDEPEQKEEFTVKKITEQDIGEEIFFPLGKKAGAFTCAEENLSFQVAMQAAGYEKADSVAAVTLNSGEGSSESGDVVTNLPVLAGKLVLPALPPEFSAPEEEELFSYEFGGWTEQNDKADVVRKPGSKFPVEERNDLYFIANWVKVVKLEIGIRRVKDTVTYSVPDVTGYDVLSYQWQTRKGQGEWTPVDGADKQDYSRKLQKGDGDREFRCTITVKKQQNALSRLFSAPKAEELSLAAVGSGLTELHETLAVKKGSGVQTVTKMISLPVSTAGSTYRVTGVTLPAGAVFVDAAAGTELPADGKTFSFEIAPTGTGWQTAGAAARLLSANPAEGSEWASGVAHLLQTGEVPVASEAGAADITVTLQYNGAYETLSGGTVELIFEEFSGEEAKNQVNASFVIEDITAVTQTAGTASGRSFLFPAANGAAAAQKGGVTAGFETSYYPAETGARNIKLSLYKKDGTAAAFPAGTKLVLADQSGETWQYYSYSNAGGKSQIALNLCGYPGPAEQDVHTVERLLFVFDFSKASATLAEGEYYLTLTHPLQSGAAEPLKQAAFTVQAGSGSASLSAEKTAESTDTLWGVHLTAAHSYPDGVWLQAALLNSAQTAIAFPEAMTLEGAEAMARNADGSIQFVPQGDTVTFDFSNVAAGAFSSGDYQIQLKMGPRPGLQNGGETSLAVTMAENLAFHYTDKTPAVTPAVRSLSVEAENRLLDASGQSANLVLSISYQNEQDGDRLRVEVLEKTGTEPGDQSYTGQSGISGYEGALTGTVTLTAPKGQQKGTYRALVSILDADGNTVAQEPYNFILK